MIPRIYEAIPHLMENFWAHKVDYSKSDDEEMEGLALGHITHANEILSNVHVIILDNDYSSKDDVYFKHFTVPDPSVL
jgi:hypothetical protein